MRVFSGKALADKQARGEVTERVVTAIRKCADHGAKFGVKMACRTTPISFRQQMTTWIC